MSQQLDPLDQQIIDLLKVNARLPIVSMAKALGCARSTAQLRLKSLEDRGIISGYTVDISISRSRPSIRAMVLISIESQHEPEIMRALTKRHEIIKKLRDSNYEGHCSLELDASQDPLRVLHLTRALFEEFVAAK